LITEEQWDELAPALIMFMGPENEDKTYARSFSHNQRQIKGTGGKLGKLNTRLERHRRKVLYRFVMVMAASGLRPHEAMGYADKSLRWRDVDEAGFSVETKQLSTRERPVVMLNVRKNTKTGKRTVPAAAGDHIAALREFAPNLDKNAMVFQDLDGSPMPLALMRDYFHEVCSRCETIDRVIDLYELRHLWATRRLKEGVPVAAVAQALGNSVAVVMKTYSHVLLSEEGMVRLLYEQQLKQG
jgi:integrase